MHETPGRNKQNQPKSLLLTNNPVVDDHPGGGEPLDLEEKECSSNKEPREQQVSFNCANSRACENWPRSKMPIISNLRHGTSFPTSAWFKRR
jgi:hypothetical protein